jgi:hypothetical protein
MTNPPGWGEIGGGTPEGWSPVQPPAAGSPPQGPPPGWQGQPGWGARPKPGVIPLRPLGVGEILDGAITSIRQNPRPMLGLTAVLAVLTQIIVVPLQIWWLGDTEEAFFDWGVATDDTQAASDVGASLITAAITGLTTMVAVIVLTGVLTVVVSRAVLGERMPTGEAWDRAKPRLPALLGVTLLISLIVLVAVVVLIAPAVLAAMAGSGGAALALAILGGLAAFVAAIYLYIRFALATAAVVLEKQGVLASLRRSTRLVHPAFWRVLGIMLLVNVIAQVVSFILAVPFSVVAGIVAVATGDGSLYDVGPATIIAVGTIVASTITWPFTAAATALLYIDQRMRREGLDLELARASGQPGQPGQP